VKGGRKRTGEKIQASSKLPKA